MLTLLEDILQENAKFIQETGIDYSQLDSAASKYPRRNLAIVTCMDTRLTGFLEPALGINRGDAKIIRFR